MSEFIQFSPLLMNIPFCKVQWKWLSLDLWNRDESLGFILCKLRRGEVLFRNFSAFLHPATLAKGEETSLYYPCLASVKKLSWGSC